MSRSFRITYEIEVEDLPLGDDVSNVSRMIAECLEMESSYAITDVKVVDAVEIDDHAETPLAP